MLVSITLLAWSKFWSRNAWPKPDAGVREQGIDRTADALCDLIERVHALHSRQIGLDRFHSCAEPAGLRSRSFDAWLVGSDQQIEAVSPVQARSRWRLL
jgi:hypothetical protein